MAGAGAGLRKNILKEDYDRKTSTAAIGFSTKSKLMETNLMEWEDHEWHSTGDSVSLTLDPFEIKTFKLKYEN